MDSHYSYDMDLTITWGDCDAAGISYYAKNFDWFTNGRMDFLEVNGFPYMETFHHQGISLVCLKADSVYKKMLRPLEKVTLRTFLSSMTRSRMVFTYEIVKENGEIAAEGMTSHAYVNNEGKPLNIQKSHQVLWDALTDKWMKFKKDGREQKND